MRLARFVRRPARATAAAAGLSLLALGAGCTNEELQAAVAGLDAAAQVLSNQSQDSGLNFGDWLANELQN